MKHLLPVLISIAFGLCACGPVSSSGDDLYDPENLLAWCVVPFDAEERSPQERAALLQELGFKHFAYDYRDEHIPSFREEIEALKKFGISMDAVWLWVDPRWDNLPGDAGRKILDILGETKSKTEIWLGLPDNAFDEIPDDECLSMSVEVVKKILVECEKLGCTLALYNHGGWFGEPDNLVRLVESVGSDNVRIVYNFHHGHHQVDHFQAYLEKMLPYLSTININGMSIDGPKIITLGEGDLELEMLRIIKESGYSGPIGILGHTEGEDIALVLERNLKGLEALKKQL